MSRSQMLIGTPRLFRSTVWVLLAGVLLGLSFPPTGYYPLAWVALVPLVVRWARARTLWSPLGDAYAAFLIMSVLAGYWTLLHEYLERAALAAGLLLVLPAVLSVPFAVGWLVRTRLGTTLGFVTLVALSLVLEHVIGQHVVPLPWAQLGYTQAEAGLLLQIADLSGASTLSLWLWLLGGLGAWVLLGSPGQRSAVRSRVAAVILLVLTVALPLTYGHLRLAALTPASSSLHVGVVQPAMSPQEWLYSDPAARVGHLASLTEALVDALEAPEERPLDLVVWPELALPAYSDAERTQRLYNRVITWARTHDVHLLTGAATRPGMLTGASSGPSATRYNSALLFTPEGAPQQSDKARAHPVFDGARYVEPPTTTAAAVADWRLSQTEQPFAAAGQKSLLALPQSSFVPLIGFESLFQERSRAYVARGGDVLVVLAQNDWWGRLPSPELHLAMTRLLSVETRRPAVMSTVNGASGVTLSDGTLAASGSAEPNATSYDVPLSAEGSLFLRQGNVLARSSLFVLLLISALFALRRLGSQTREPSPRPRMLGHEDDDLEARRTPGLTWPEAPPAYEDLTPDPAGDGEGIGGNPASPPPVPEPPPPPSPPASVPWSTSRFPSSSPQAPPADAPSSTPWASPSRFASPVTPKPFQPASRPDEP